MTSPNDAEPLWQEFDALQHELGDDVQFFFHTKRHQKNQHWRRAFCRAVSAYSEAMTAWMARYTIRSGELGNVEQKVLEARLSAVQRAFHAIDLFTNVAGADSPLVRDSAEWQALTAIIRL